MHILNPHLGQLPPLIQPQWASRNGARSEDGYRAPEYLLCMVRLRPWTVLAELIMW